MNSATGTLSAEFFGDEYGGLPMNVGQTAQAVIHVVQSEDCFGVVPGILMGDFVSQFVQRKPGVGIDKVEFFHPVQDIKKRFSFDVFPSQLEYAGKNLFAKSILKPGKTVNHLVEKT